MIFTHENIKEELIRFKKLAGDDQYVSAQTVGMHRVLDAHFLLQDHFHDLGEGVGGIGPRDLNLLHSALSRQFTSFGGHSRWSDPFELVATLFFGLIRNHPFHDCNKRTALLTSAYHIDTLGRVPEIPELEYEDLAVRVAERTLFEKQGFDKFKRDTDAEIKYLAHYFRHHSRQANKRNYIISYQQLATILKRFDCRLGHPDGNYIHVEKLVSKRNFLFQTRQEWQRMLQIRFPGMKSEVHMSDLKRLRKILELTHADGVDSEVFYHESEPLQSFIAKYERPLRKLADK